MFQDTLYNLILQLSQLQGIQLAVQLTVQLAVQLTIKEASNNLYYKEFCMRFININLDIGWQWLL